MPVKRELAKLQLYLMTIDIFLTRSFCMICLLYAMGPVHVKWFMLIFFERDQNLQGADENFAYIKSAVCLQNTYFDLALHLFNIQK